MRLTIHLPDDVWHRLADEAAAKDMSIGKHVQQLINDRDARQQKKGSQ